MRKYRNIIILLVFLGVVLFIIFSTISPRESVTAVNPDFYASDSKHIKLGEKIRLDFYTTFTITGIRELEPGKYWEVLGNFSANDLKNIHSKYSFSTGKDDVLNYDTSLSGVVENDEINFKRLILVNNGVENPDMDQIYIQNNQISKIVYAIDLNN